ncbi:transcription termination factor 1, mitochondrial isoform X2 [Onychomys torridus]|uniref:transcription termination factor 1, mitochondrial isoform X2 n=1 Tax=Onychomys torridus TaxID=38674 RepID=UPI00167F3937|nr:transcription termination factor 1, mitochondrial isoform X2 [Onychomys torridus]
MIMASRNVWCMTRNFLFGSRGWMIQYSAEIFLKSISLRPFSVKCDSKDKEPLKNEDLLKNLLTMGVDVDMARRRQPGVFNRSTFNLNKENLLLLICGPGAGILDLSNDCTKRNYTNVQEKLLSLGCTNEEVQKFVLSYLNVVFLSEKKFNDKIDCLIEGKISISQIIENPRVLDASITTLKTRIKELAHAGYDLSSSNIALLSWSQKRYKAKLKRLNG